MIIETKFSVGDIVWCMHDNEPLRIYISAVNIRCDGNFTVATYDDCDETSWPEKKLFATKEELRKHLFGE